MTQLTIPARYNGPSNSGNGGYCAGLFCQQLAADTDKAITVVLRSPPPLDKAIDYVTNSTHDAAKVVDGETLIAELYFDELSMTPPPAISWQQAETASQQFTGFKDHPFAHCYVCGPKREPCDGLRIFAGPCEGMAMAAATWQAFPALADASGNIAREHLWAALDCPSYFGATVHHPQQAAFLGTMTLQLLQPTMPADARYIIQSWPIAIEGRKLIGGVALYNEQGECLAVAKAVWITLNP